MAEVEKYARDLAKLSGLIKEAGDVARNVCGWPIEQLVESYGSMYDRFCPHKIGDRVILIKTPDFTKAPGWRGAEHWLKAGVVGTVRERGYSDGQFTFAVEFDDESWKDRDNGKVHPIKDKHTYHFRERELVRA